MTPIKYPNLENLIRVRGIKRIAISRKLKISDRTLRNKMQGIADFTWSETTSIQRNFFPDVELEFLFSPGDEKTNELPQNHATAWCPMSSKWKVTSQYIGDRKMYAVYRLIDMNAVDHSGNREYAGGFMADRAAAQALVDQLNGEEGHA